MKNARSWRTHVASVLWWDESRVEGLQCPPSSAQFQVVAMKPPGQQNNLNW